MRTRNGHTLKLSRAKDLDSGELRVLAGGLRARYAGTKHGLAAERDAATLHYAARALRRWPGYEAVISGGALARIEALVDKVLARWGCGIKYEL